MSVVSHHRADLPVRTGVFVRCLGVIRIAGPAVPTVEPRHLVADKTRVGPTRSPKNRFAHRGFHDQPAVIGHFGGTATRRASERIEAASPVNAEHRSFVLSSDG